MMRGIADRLGEFGEARRLLGLLDQLHRLRDGFAVAADLVGLAAQAGPIAGSARFLAVAKNSTFSRFGRRAGQLGLQ